MKKILTLILSIIMAIGTSSIIYASDEHELYGSPIAENSGVHNEFEMFIIEDGEDYDSEIQPFKTIEGPDGKAFLDYAGAGYVEWSVRPDTMLPYVFTGSMKFFNNDTGKLLGMEDLYVAGVGRLGDGADAFQFNIKKGTEVRALLTGIAVDESGKKFRVSSGAYIIFNV